MADGSLVLSGEPFPSQEPFPVRAKLQREQGGRMQGQTMSVYVCEGRQISWETGAATIPINQVLQ